MEEGFWDLVRTLRGDAIRVAGLVAGDRGVLVLRLPGVAETEHLVAAAEARALLAALAARVSPPPDGLVWAKTPVAVQVAGGYVETTFADGTVSVEPADADGADGWGDPDEGED